jgi:hypothetical protein
MAFWRHSPPEGDVLCISMLANMGFRRPGCFGLVLLLWLFSEGLFLFSLLKKKKEKKVSRQ